MKKILGALAVSIGAVFTPLLSARAEFVDGNKLHRYCQSEKGDLFDGLCAGFSVGIADAIISDGSVEGLRACFLGPITVGQVRDVVAKHLSDNPAQRHRPASSLVALALSRAFPCPR